MKRPALMVGMFALLGLLAACSKEPVIPPAAPPVNDLFTKLERFSGKPPADLLKDEQIGKLIRSLVPQADFKCLDEAMEWMPDLELASDGSLGVRQTGSHADQFRETYLSITPKGSFDLVLLCQIDAPGIPKGKYQYFTNSADLNSPSRPVKEWLYSLGQVGDIVTVSNGKQVMDVPFDTFVAELSTGAAAPITQQTALVDSEGQITAPKSVEGQWECRTTNEDGVVAQTFFLFKDRMLAYNVGKSLQLVSYDSETLGTGRRGTFKEITRNGRTVGANVLYVIDFMSAEPGGLAFNMKMITPRGDDLSRSSCVPLAGNTNQTPAQTSAPAPAPRAATSREQFVAEGATICTDLKAMNRAVALQRAGHVAGLPDDCLLAPRTLSVRVLGASPMPGILVVQVGAHQAFVQSADVSLR